jgi:hypothetical protein
MPEIYVKDEIYKNISNSHGDVSKFVNMVLNQYLDAFKPENTEGIEHYTSHGNGD